MLYNYYIIFFLIVLTQFYYIIILSRHVNTLKKVEESNKHIVVDVLWIGFFPDKYGDNSWFNSETFGGGALVKAKVTDLEICVLNTQNNLQLCSQRWLWTGDPIRNIKHCQQFLDFAVSYRLTKELLQRPKDIYHWLMFLDDDSIPCPSFDIYFAAITKWILMNIDIEQTFTGFKIGRGTSGNMIPLKDDIYFEEYLNSVINSALSYGTSSWRSTEKTYINFDTLLIYMYVSVMESLGKGRFYTFQLNIIEHLPDFEDHLTTTQGWDKYTLIERRRDSPRCLEPLIPTSLDGYFDSNCAGYFISPCREPNMIPWKIGNPVLRNLPLQTKKLPISTEFIIGAEGHSCITSCGNINKVCNLEGRELINNCENVGLLLSANIDECMYSGLEIAPYMEGNIAYVSVWDKQINGGIHPFHEIEKWCNAVDINNPLPRICACS